MNSEALLKEMVNAFLSWPLPESVRSDECVTMSNYPHPRIGTSLLTAPEAEAMFRAIALPVIAQMQKEFADAVVEWTKCQEELSGCRSTIAHLEEHKTRLRAQLKARPSSEETGNIKDWRVDLLLPRKGDPFDRASCRVVDIGWADKVLTVECHAPIAQIAPPLPYIGDGKDGERLDKLIASMAPTFLENPMGWVCLDESSFPPGQPEETMTNFKHWRTPREAIDHIGERTPEGEAFLHITIGRAAQSPQAGREEK